MCERTQHWARDGGEGKRSYAIGNYCSLELSPARRKIRRCSDKEDVLYLEEIMLSRFHLRSSIEFHILFANAHVRELCVLWNPSRQVPRERALKFLRGRI